MIGKLFLEENAVFPVFDLGICNEVFVIMMM